MNHHCKKLQETLTNHVPDFETLLLSCIDKRSRNAPGQHGGSLQTRFIESMRAHIITIYGKRTGRP